MTGFSFRLASNDDAEHLAALYSGSELAGAPASAAEADVMMQTGQAFLLAEAGGKLHGAVRFHDEEGIGWFDLLVSARPWAGTALVRAIERGCQDRGIRLVRARCEDVYVLPDYFSRLGYMPIGRGTNEAGTPELLIERRLPLLTVREQRRSDAPAIGELTGEDPWVFEQGARPGWFVAADGEKVIGVVQAAEAGRGTARISEPLLSDAYKARGLELWMIERASTYAETNGAHSAEMEATPSLTALRKGLEDRFWTLEGPRWRRVFFVPKQDDEDDW